jgi:hypothetical protein
VNPSGGRDLINVGDAGNTLNGIQGPLILIGISGDPLVLNDQGNLTPSTYTTTANSVTRTGIATITFSTLDSGVSLDLHQGALTGAEAGFSANQKYVAQLFRDLLQRNADAAGLAGFAGFLDHGGSRQQAAQIILASPEYRGLVVNGIYESLLHREADAGGLQGFVNFLGTGGTIEQVQALIAGSDEYFLLHGATNNGFLAGLYSDALDRAPDAAGLAAFQGALAGGLSRSQAATLVFTSGERRADLVDGFYQQLLRRGESAAEQSAFVGLLNQGVRDEAVVALFAASGEYFSLATR